MELQGPVHRPGWTSAWLRRDAKRRRPPGGCSLRPECRPEVVHTSVLTRAISTANGALEAAGLSWLPVTRSWRLNERHYGALQGKDKAQTGARSSATSSSRPGAVPTTCRRRRSPTMTRSPRWATRGTPPCPPSSCHAPSACATSWRGCFPTGTDAIRPGSRGRPDGVRGSARQLAARNWSSTLDGVSDAAIAELNITDGHTACCMSLTTRSSPRLSGGRYLDPEGGHRGSRGR